MLIDVSSFTVHSVVFVIDVSGQVLKSWSEWRQKGVAVAASLLLVRQPWERTRLQVNSQRHLNSNSSKQQTLHIIRTLQMTGKSQNVAAEWIVLSFLQSLQTNAGTGPKNSPWYCTADSVHCVICWLTCKRSKKVCIQYSIKKEEEEEEEAVKIVMELLNTSFLNNLCSIKHPDFCVSAAFSKQTCFYCICCSFSSVHIFILLLDSFSGRRWSYEICRTGRTVE